MARILDIRRDPATGGMVAEAEPGIFLGEQRWVPSAEGLRATITLTPVRDPALPLLDGRAGFADQPWENVGIIADDDQPLTRGLIKASAPQVPQAAGEGFAMRVPPGWRLRDPAQIEATKAIEGVLVVPARDGSARVARSACAVTSASSSAAVGAPIWSSTTRSVSRSCASRSMVLGKFWPRAP